MPTSKRVNTISFLVILLLVFILIAWILKPFVSILAFALITSILFYPVYQFMLKRVRKSWIASLITVLIILLIIAIPLVLFGNVIYSQLHDLYNNYRNGSFIISRDSLVASLPEQARNAITHFSEDINNLFGKIYSNAFNSFSGILSNIFGFIVALFIYVFVVFYLLKDGKNIKQVLMKISPIAHNQETVIIDKIVVAVNGVVKGSFLTALSQGIVATIGFYIFHVPEPLIWGAFTVLAALVPTVGTSISLIPAVIYLAVTGHGTQAFGLAIWGALAVGTIDNFIGPKLIGRSTKLHPVLALLSVLGGVQFFGILGFLIGPILMAVFVAMVEIYQTDFSSNLND